MRAGLIQRAPAPTGQHLMANAINITLVCCPGGLDPKEPVVAASYSNPDGVRPLPPFYS